MLSGYLGAGWHVGLLCSASSLYSCRETRPDLEPKGQGVTLSLSAPDEISTENYNWSRRRAEQRAPRLSCCR
jgi:hypothetical protein